MSTSCFVFLGSPWGPCNAECDGTGNQTSTYSISVPASRFGASCPAASGDVRTRPCTGSCSKSCVGAFVYGECSVACGGGTQEGTYLVTSPATEGGKTCSHANGTISSRPCNTHTCVQPSQLATVSVEVIKLAILQWVVSLAAATSHTNWCRSLQGFAHRYHSFSTICF